MKKGLGILAKDWQGKRESYKIAIPKPKPTDHNFRLPSSDLSGDNALFIPVGTASGGIAKVEVDQVPFIK